MQIYPHLYGNMIFLQTRSSDKVQPISSYFMHSYILFLFIVFGSVANESKFLPHTFISDGFKNQHSLVYKNFRGFVVSIRKLINACQSYFSTAFCTRSHFEKYRYVLVNELPVFLLKYSWP